MIRPVQSVSMESLSAGGAMITVAWNIPAGLGSVEAFSWQYTCMRLDSAEVTCWGFDNDHLLNVLLGFLKHLCRSHRSAITCSVGRFGQIQCWGNDDLIELDIPMQLDVTLGFEDAPFGYMRRSDYQFEPDLYASSHVFELGVMDMQQGPTLKLGCFNTSGTYVVTCGDGVDANRDACDDGNRLDGDGCNELHRGRRMTQAPGMFRQWMSFWHGLLWLVAARGPAIPDQALSLL